MQTQDAKSIAVVESFPTCVDAGRTIYTAWFGNVAFMPQTKAVGTDPLGHVWGDWTVTKPATETEEGEETRTCGRCGVTETRAMPKIVPGVVTYRCVSDEATWTLGSDEPVVFTFERNAADELTFSHFTGVSVDDKALEASAFNAVAGSVVLTLKPEYLNTLDEGKHSVKALFDDGDPAEATLVVRPAEEEGKEENKEEGKEENKEERKEEKKEEGKEEGKKGSEKKSGGETSPTDGTPSASGASNVSNVSGTSRISTTTSNASTHSRHGRCHTLLGNRPAPGRTRRNGLRGSLSVSREEEHALGLKIAVILTFPKSHALLGRDVVVSAISEMEDLWTGAQWWDEPVPPCVVKVR